MKATRQYRNLPYPYHPGRADAGSLMGWEEQIASTGVERPWIIVSLGLVVLILGVYWLNEQHPAQPVRPVAAVTATPGSDRMASRVIGAAANSSGITDTSVPETADPDPGSPLSENERLVRRFYEEVLNRREFAVMEELFADRIVYQDLGKTITVWDRAALRDRFRANLNAYHDPYYTVQQVIIAGNRVGVYWQAAEQSVDVSGPSSRGTPLAWSGYTVWTLENGQVIEMREYDGTEFQRAITPESGKE